MKILIPPSEGKSLINTSSVKFKNTNYKFNNEVKGIIKMLNNCKPDDLQKIYGTSIEKCNELHKNNLNIFESECSMSMERYTGVVYNYLDPSSLEKKSYDFLRENFLITSALFGLVSPNDFLPFYKLKMNVLRLHEYLNPIFTEYLKNEELIIDLLPEIHRKSYKSKNILKINFFFKKKGKIVSSGHNGKAIKGKYLRYIVENQITTIEGFKSFSQDGFIWHEKGFLKEI